MRHRKISISKAVAKKPPVLRSPKGEDASSLGRTRFGYKGGGKSR